VFRARTVNEDDAQLVARCLSGENGAFDALYQAYAPRAWAYFLRSGFSRPDADDLAQETFSRVFRSLATFDATRGAMRAWVATIARNVARKRWGRRAQAENFDPALAEDVLAGGDDPVSTAGRDEEIAAVRDCIERLEEPLRQIVRLRYVEGRTTRGVGVAAGMPEATVRSRLAEAHGRLRRCLEGKGVVGEIP